MPIRSGAFAPTSSHPEKSTMKLRTHRVSSRRIIAVLVSLAATLALSGCQESQPTKPPAPRPIMTGPTLRFPIDHPQLASLRTAQAEPSRPVTIDMPARVIWDEDRTQRIYPAFSGRVSAIRADVGSQVVVGQVLAELASPEFGVAQADAGRARTELSHAQRQLERTRDLHSIGIAARKELEQAETDVLRAQTELDRAQARTRL